MFIFLTGVTVLMKGFYWESGVSEAVEEKGHIFM